MDIRKIAAKARINSSLMATGKINRGYCTLCDKRVSFAKTGPWLRDQYICLSCHSIPRCRALHRVLGQHFPSWRDLRIHESSPDGPSSEKIGRESRNLVTSQFFPDVPRGESKDGQRSEDLESLTFADNSFDLVITQDVFEHILHPEKAFAEIARTLECDGAHVFHGSVLSGKEDRSCAPAPRGPAKWNI